MKRENWKRFRQIKQLNDFLREFIITVKRKDGDEFEPSGLTKRISFQLPP